MLVLERSLHREFAEDVLSQTRAEWQLSSIPVVLLVEAVDSSDELARCLSSPVVDHLTKPFHFVTSKRREDRALRTRTQNNFAVNPRPHGRG